MTDKTFTQEEVNTIVQDRLAKEKAKYDKQIADMQADIIRREKRLEAREKLQEKGLPAELADLVRLDDDEAFKTSLELLEKTFIQQQRPTSQAKKETVQKPAYNPMGGTGAHSDPIREAMGLRA